MNPKNKQIRKQEKNRLKLQKIENFQKTILKKLKIINLKAIEKEC